MTADRPEQGWGFLRSRRWAGYVALVVLFSIICALLGQWQFARRAQARAEIDRIDANYSAPARPVAEVLPQRDVYDDDANKWQTVSVTGEYLDEVMLVRNRPNAQSVGFNMLAMLRSDAGEVLVVDRGWIPAGSTPDTPGVILPPPEGTVTVTARLKGSEPMISGRERSGNTVATINLPQLEQIVDEPLYTGAYGLLETESVPAEAGALPAKPERDEGPHLSYALQWYVFIVMAWIGLAYAARQEYRSLNPHSERTLREDRKRREKRIRRGPSDAEEEDAIIDAAEAGER